MSTEQELTATPLFKRKVPFVAGATQNLTGIEPADFEAIFNGYIDSTNKAWGHDRTKTLGGSEVFGCIRKAWYSRHGTPKDADYVESWGATRRGDLIENYHVVPAMQWGSAEKGFKIDYVGTDQQTLFCDGVPMSVTPDGLIHGIPRDWLKNYGIPDIKSDCVMFEIKSIDPRVDLSEEKSIHHGQTQIQMGLVRENTQFRPHYAVILYVNASFFDDMSVFVVEWDPKKYDIAKKRAHIVYDTEKPDLLPREGNIDNSCNYCPFVGTCMSNMVSEFPPEEKAPEPEIGEDGKKKRKKAKPGTNPELAERLEDLMQRSHKARAALKKADKEDKLLKEEIKTVLREFRARRAKDGNWSVSYSLSPGRKTLDKDSLVLGFSTLKRIIDEAGLNDQVDEALRDLGIIEEGRNEPVVLDDIEMWMKSGDPFEVLRLTFTEPDAEEL